MISQKVLKAQKKKPLPFKPVPLRPIASALAKTAPNPQLKAKPQPQRKSPTKRLPKQAQQQKLLPDIEEHAKHDADQPQGHYWWYVAGFAISLFVFGGAAMLALSHKATGWEYAWFRELNGQSEGWYRLMTIITFFGSTWGAVVAVGTAFITRYYRLAWRMAVTIIGAYGVAFLAKHAIDRARPGELFQHVHVRMAEDGMGFPSGHTTVITVIALTLLPYIPWKARWILLLAVLLVGISRLYLGVHIPLDVIGGIALGTAAVSFIRILPQKLRYWLHLT